ncbi:type II toxin-antitoxin system RelE/ParE family toxin [Xylophilus rhododendri]|uniref:Type II toxin-antitoxin system RelE/ParE family toxin n=1 Tax=Xylophilus rhododendri TaxID=2697032 RepID=A0A857JBW9_9BURK|nr:type II toxin-antitoxin system RelE/ParE family toxin [Xylophilus rhododendri]QHJ00196.1 type II toxin-antitoxin system RelE/ParE family toxin [Xylophilus rhododendri]
MKVVFLESAEADLQELRRYILKDFGPGTWRSSFAKIKKAVALIAAEPRAGRLLPEFESLNIAAYRQVLAGMNRIIYEVQDEVAYIYVVCDTRRDLQGLLLRRLVRGL